MPHLSSNLPDLSSLLADMATVLEAGAPVATSVPTVKDEQALARWLWESFGVRLPDVAVCDGHSTPWRAFCDCYFARHSTVVVKASRGLGGKTWMLGALALAEGALLGADVVLLGGSGAQSARVHRAMKRFWAHPGSPRDLLVGEPLVTLTRFRGGNEVQALTASQTSVRGEHPHRLRLDEVDSMAWDIYDAATGLTMGSEMTSISGSVPAQTCIASTHQNPSGTMTKVLELAAERGWPIHSWCWRETVAPHGWLAPSEVARKRGEMTTETWGTEVELGEPSSENLAITSVAVEAMFDANLGETESPVGKDEVFEAPDPDGGYAHGADWGKKRDFSAVATVRTDADPAQFVAFYRDRRKPYHLMAEQLNVRQRLYGGHASHDRNGVGESVHEHLTGEVEGFTAWQGPERIRLFSRYITAIERGRVRAPRSAVWYRAHRYVTRDDLYGNGHPPDEFIACALAWRAAERSPLLLVTGARSMAEISEAARAEYEKAKTAAAIKAVEEQVRKGGVFWPGGGNGHGDGGGLR